MAKKSEEDVILVIDDNTENLKFIGNALRDNQYQPVVAQNAQQALDYLAKEMPELILLDIMMPEMDGFELCEQIKLKKNLEDIPIIFLTAKTDTESVVKGFEMGAADFVSKPFKLAELLARIKTHIGFKHAREEIKTLRGLIPICSSCKKVRDDEGIWNQIEIYIENRSDAFFSHGICPGCAEKLYGDRDWFKKSR